MTDIYRAERDLTPVFLKNIENWINESGEVFVVLRYLRRAGAKDFAFCRSITDFRRLCDHVPTGTDIVVFRLRQLPIRGAVSAEFVAEVLRTIPHGAEYLIVDLRPYQHGTGLLPGRMGTTHAELREDIQDLTGRDVAVGLCPKFTDADHEDMISAAKGGIDGPR